MEGFNDREEEWGSDDDDEEEELSEEDVEESYSEKARRQIESNDPALVKLEISGGSDWEGGNHSSYWPTDCDWERDGKSIGRNTKLREVALDFIAEEPAYEDFVNFFLGLASNRSIKKLSFYNCNDLFYGEIFCILIPFFKENRNFESLVIDERGNTWPKYLRTLTSAFGFFDSLKEFILNCVIDEAGQGDAQAREVRKLVQALSGHSGLRKLVLRNLRIGRNGCAALSSLLQNQGSNLAVLDLSESEIDNEAAIILATGLTGSGTLRELNLRWNPNISQPGWQALLQFLRSPNSALEELDLSHNRFNNDVISSLANSLVNNIKLRKVNLSYNRGVTVTGWQAFSIVLQNPDSALESLDLSSNQIDDDASNYLANALANNNKLRKLDLSDNNGVTAAGCEALSVVLRNPNSAMEKFHLRYNYIHDRTLTTFANSLTTNNKLKELMMGGFRGGFGGRLHADRWGAFLPVLCNTSSIMATYRSNHTLEKLCDEDEEDELPEELRSLLLLNRENSRSQAARLKIIKTHFTGSNIVMQPFIGMELNVLPFAIAWMGRGGIDTEGTWGEGFGLLYQFSRAMLPMIDSTNGSGTKRKRDL